MLQGLTLEEVVIDFTENKELNIKNFICPGGFYVALTRVKQSSKVFLKGFDPSYIATDKSLKEKVNSFRKFNNYVVKKVYLDENIFEDPEQEFKIGYLNICGLMDAYHGEYLNSDRNLLALDMLVIAESHLTKNISDQDVANVLARWKVVWRHDGDNQKHMGLLFVVPREREEYIVPHIASFSDCLLHNGKQLSIQGLKVHFEVGLDLGFVYCKKTPTLKETEAMRKTFDSCDFFFGDLNLSSYKPEDKAKLDILCGNDKYLALFELQST